MPILERLFPINIPDAGLTLGLQGDDPIDRYVVALTQTGTMAGNVSITGTDAFLASPNGNVYYVEFPGGMTLGGNTCTIFGKALTAAQALNPCLIIARWDGAAYDTQIYTDWSANNTVLLAHMNANSVGTSQIVDAAVTWAKLQALARGSILRGSATNVVEALALASGRFPLGDGTDVTAGVMSADATLAGTGALTIANNAITTAKILDSAVTWAKLQSLARGSILRGSSANVVEALSLSGAGAGAFVGTDATDVLALVMSGDGTLDGSGVLTIDAGLNTYITKVTIPTASVLTANTTPISLVGAPGASKYIRPIACMNTLTFNSVAYATNGQVNLRHQTATDPCMIVGSSFLFGSVTHTSVMVENQINAVTDTQIIVNQPLLWEVNAGDPTAGDSDIICYLIYQVVDV